jgi:pilus assembly protein CpaF
MKAKNTSVDELCKIFYQNSELEFDVNSALFTGSAKFIVKQARHLLAQKDLEGRNPSENDLIEFVKSIEVKEKEQLSEQERTAVVATLLRNFENFDVLSRLVDDSEVNDIIVKSFDDISIQKGRANYQTGLAFGDSENYKAFVEQLLKRAGKACTVSNPVVDASVGPDIRLCVTHESLTPEGRCPLLTIRLARHAKPSLSLLEQNGLAPKLVLDYLSKIVESGDSTILIAGEVGTGKTTLVRALLNCIPEREAILIIEDTQEIKLDRKFSRTLLTREANSEGTGRVSPAQAIRAGLRMAINRIILGEMRDGEAAESFVDACSSGHPGLSTIHARSARDAISRMELFLSRAQPNVTMETIRRQIAGAVSVIVYLGIDPIYRERRILEIVEIDSASEGLVQISPIFSYDKKVSLPIWTRQAGVSSLVSKDFILPPSGTRVGLDSIAAYSTYTNGAQR